MSDLTITLTPAEQNIVRQALRAEGERMKKQGFTQLGQLALDTSSKIANAILDNKMLIG